MKVWTVLLQDGGQGWVMGVFESAEQAIARLRAYEAEYGGNELGEPTYGMGDDPMCEIPITNGEPGDRFVIAAHVLGECNP